MAAVVRQWVGTTTVFATAGNWLPATVPLTTDPITIPKGATYGIAGIYNAFYPVTSGDYPSFTYEAGCSVAIGSRQNPLWLVLTASTGHLDLYGSGACYFTGTFPIINVANGQNFNIVDVEGVAPTLTTANIFSGALRITTGAITAANILAGTLTYGDAGKCVTAITTLTLDSAGKCVYNSNQNITTINLHGTLDLSGDSRTFTAATVNWYPGGKIIDPHKRLTITTLTPAKGLTLSAS